MTFNTDWDINKYKTEFEADDHWNLRKDFLLAHKERFPEEKLVCLAQVFYNVEFLGCRYPEKTMKLVEEMSKEIAAEHREIKKGKLQRTFVKASDAATARIQGPKPNRTDDLSGSKGPPKFVASNDSCRNQFLARNDPGLNSAAPIVSDRDQEHKLTLAKIQRIQGPCGSMVVLWQRNQYSWTTLQRTAATWKMIDRLSTDEKILKNTPDGRNIWRAMAKYGDVVGVADSVNRNHAKTAACHLVIWKLQQHYYSIEICEGFNKKSIAGREPDVQKGEKRVEEPAVAADNVGSKMMKMMGWTGGGLGKNQQGIEKPIEAKGNVVKRAGFGVDAGSTIQIHEIRKLINDYKRREDDFSDLVFSSEFTNVERKAVHQIAKSMDLKSKSVGKNEDRQLIVSKKAQLLRSPWVFIENFLKVGETEFENYKLIPPKTTELPEMEGVTYHPQLGKM